MNRFTLLPLKNDKMKIWKCPSYFSGFLISPEWHLCKGKRYFDISRKKFKTFLSLPNQLCICNCHKASKLAQGKFAVGQGKHREFENAI